LIGAEPRPAGDHVAVDGQHRQAALLPESAPARMADQGAFYVYAAFLFTYGTTILHSSRDLLLSALVSLLLIANNWLWPSHPAPWSVGGGLLAGLLLPGYLLVGLLFAWEEVLVVVETQVEQISALSGLRRRLVRMLHSR